MHINNFKGLITALITPFANNKIDYKSLELILEIQIRAKVKSVVIAGSTGEGSALSLKEYKNLLEFAVKKASGALTIIAGCNALSTTKTIELADIAQSLGVDAIMCVTPAYTKPNQAGVIAHYEEIDKNCSLPMIIYSVPSRTGIDLTDETLIALSAIPKIVAFKDAANDINRPLRLADKVSYNMLAGDDASAVQYMLNGGVGCVSVASNIIPDQLQIMYDLFTNANADEAQELNGKLTTLLEALCIDTNPVPIKHIMAMNMLCLPHVRLPLVEISHDKAQYLSKLYHNKAFIV